MSDNQETIKQPNVFAIVMVILAVAVVLYWVLMHLHEPCETFNMSTDFWGRCVR